MVKHIVLYTFKEGVNKEEAITVIRDSLYPLVGKISGLQMLEVKLAFNGMDYALYSEFESREALKNYATHPLHLEAKDHFWNFLNERFCADYEL